MNLEKDLQRLKKEKALKESAIAQLRKRSKDSLARPRAEKNILSTNLNAKSNESVNIKKINKHHVKKRI